MSKKLDTVILQDGANALFKNGSASTDNRFDDFNTLVEAVREQFEPTNFVICEVPQSCRTKKGIKQLPSSTNSHMRNMRTVLLY